MIYLAHVFLQFQISILQYLKITLQDKKISVQVAMNFLKVYLFVFFLAIKVDSLIDLIIPTLNKLSTIETNQTSSILRMQTNLNTIMIVTSSHLVLTWNATTFISSTSPSAVVNNFFNISLYYIEFSNDQIDSVSLLAHSRLSVVNLTTNTLLFHYARTDTNLNIQPQLTANMLIFLASNRTLSIYNRANYINQSYIIPQTILLSTQSARNHIKFCQINSQLQYLVYWNDCNGIVLAKINNMSLLNIFNWSSTYPLCNGNIKQIKFNKNCSLIIIQMDNLTTIQIFNTITLTTYAIIDKPTQKVYQVQFYDPIKSDIVMVFYQNNSIAFYDITQGTGINIGLINQNITLNQFSYIDINDWRLYQLQNSNIIIYQLQCANKNQIQNRCCQTNQYYANFSANCVQCKTIYNFCNVCNKTACLSCLTGTLFDGKCCQANQYYNSSLLVCQLCSSLFQNCLTCSFLSCFSCYNQLIIPSQTVNCSYDQNRNSAQLQCQFCMSMVDKLYPTVNQITKIASFILITSRLTSITILLITFINYWRICSLYSLIQSILIPKYLQKLLNQIYNSVNISFFKFLGIDFNFNTQLNNKLDKYISEYNFTSDFINMHIQSLLTLLISCLVFCLLVLIKQKINKYFLFDFKFYIDFQIIFIAQLMQNASQFFFSYSFIIRNINWLTFTQELNVIPHIVCIGILLVIPFFLFQHNKYQKNEKIIKYKNVNNHTKIQKKTQIQQQYICKSTNKKLKQQNKQKHKQEKQNQESFQQQLKKKIQYKYNASREVFYLGLCSCYMPLVIIVDIKPIIFIAGIFIFSYGIYTATKQKQFRISKIILSSYILIFHLSFFVLIFTQVDYISGFICLITLIIGGLHSILSLFTQLILQIHKITKRLFFSSQIKDQQLAYKQNNKNRQQAVKIDIKFLTKNQFVQDKLKQQQSKTSIHKLQYKKQENSKKQKSLKKRKGNIINITNIGQYNNDKDEQQINNQTNKVFYNQSKVINYKQSQVIINNKRKMNRFPTNK